MSTKQILRKDIRKDANGTIISKNNKYHISFKESLVEIIYIESFKKSLIFEEDKNIYDNFEDVYDDKFDINEFNQTQFEYQKNKDPNSICNGCCIY